MNANKIEGRVNKAAGKAQAVAGEVLDDAEMKIDGAVDSLDGRVHELIGAAQDAISDAADKVSVASAQLGEQARNAYARINDGVHKTAEQVDPFVKEKPYAALGLAAVGGLFLGMLYAGRGPKIVYVKPRA